jgi:carboxylesterase
VQVNSAYPSDTTQQAQEFFPGMIGRVNAGDKRTVAKMGYSGSDISDEGLRYENPGLRAFPISALEALLDLMDTVRADLPAIRTPVLVVHGRQDHTVPMEDSLELTGCLGSEVIERLWLDKSFHIVTLDVERDTVIDTATRFLAQHAWPPDSSAA